MIRALFLAIGICLLILGTEFLFVEKAMLEDERMLTAATWFDEAVYSQRREISPPKWAPFSMLAAGAIVLIYSFTIPRRVRG